jgi:hypothetical protein
MKRARAGASPRGVNLSTAVILSAAKDLWLGTAQILRCAQDDRWRAGRPQRRSLKHVKAGPSWLKLTPLGASPAPTIDDRIVSFARKCNGQSHRSMVGATLAVALPSQLAVALVSASLALVFAFLLPIPLAHAAANGRIYGQLLDGTKKNAPVVGQSVTLQMAQGNNARDVTSIKTDARGAFAFNGLNTDKTINYAVYTRYQGAQYYTNLIDLSTKPVQQANLTVYEATTSSTDIAIVQATVLLHEPDAQGGVLSISEVFFFKNVGTYTYVGSLDASKGKPNALRFALSPQARNVTLDKGFDGYQALQVDKGFATDAALPPGTSQFIFSFQLPYKAATYDLSYDVVYPTVQLSLLVPTDVNVNSSALASKGLITAGQHPYRLYQAKDLLAGTAIWAQLQGLPVVQSAPGSLNPANLWLIVGLLLMLAILAVTWFLYRFTRRPARRGVKYRARPRSKSSGVRIDVPGAPASRAEGTAEGQEKKTGVAVHSQQQALLRELMELDKAYEAGKLKKAAYQERRAKTKARLRTLMSEENAARANTQKM